MSKKPTPDVTVSKITAIIELKKQFPGNNPATWSRNSNKVLAEWYAEYILKDVTKFVKVQ
jgi:hypothetical protein